MDQLDNEFCDQTIEGDTKDISKNKSKSVLNKSSSSSALSNLMGMVRSRNTPSGAKIDTQF